MLVAASAQPRRLRWDAQCARHTSSQPSTERQKWLLGSVRQGVFTTREKVSGQIVPASEMDTNETGATADVGTRWRGDAILIT